MEDALLNWIKVVLLFFLDFLWRDREFLLFFLACIGLALWFTSLISSGVKAALKETVVPLLTEISSKLDRVTPLLTEVSEKLDKLDGKVDGISWQLDELSPRQSESDDDG